MIVKHDLNPVRVVEYVWRPVGLAAVVAVTAVVLRVAAGGEVGLPFPPVATLGAALAIFVAFRNNASYARWWEARTAWGSIQNLCRVLTRQLVAATDNALAAGTAGPRDEVLAYRRELALRVAAFPHAVRLTLRAPRTPYDVPSPRHEGPHSQVDWAVLRPLLPQAAFEAAVRSVNVPNLLLQQLAVRVKDGVRQGMIGQFDPISIEPSLVGLNTALATCERLRDTPTPRQYDYFTRRAVTVFSLVLPFGLLGLVPATAHVVTTAVTVVVLTVVVAGVFVVLERVGSIVDTPFANTTTDVPLTYLSTAVEREVRDQVDDRDLPPAVLAVDGYLW